MIGKLRGIIDSIHDDHVIIDVGGVGYAAFCSTRTQGALSEGEAAQLIIETHVREDHIHLYGFMDEVEREWFRLLTSVQRVGAKMALSIQGAMTAAQLTQAILAGDLGAFKGISGVGGKLAERIITELKDKVGKMPVSGSALLVAGKRNAPATNNQQPTTSDAISALVNLGYSRPEAHAAAARAAQNAGESATLDQVIKLSLKELAR